ncbi:MAG: hypothetical protein AAF517_11705 [Planctomycetota bacterium]
MSDHHDDETPIIIEPDELFRDDEDVAADVETVPIIIEPSEEQEPTAEEAEAENSVDASEEDGLVVILMEEDEIHAVATATEEVVQEEQEQEDEEDDGLSLEQIEELVDEELDEELSYERKNRGRPVSLRFAYLAVSGLVAGLLLVLLKVGWKYYSLPLFERPLHYLHEALRPSGPIGLSLGVAGLAVMLVSLTYLIRKKWISLTDMGPIQNWLGMHIVTGTVGPMLILFHAALVPYSALGLIAFAAMLIVVFSGVMGRYIYVLTPKTLEGRELGYETVRQRLTVYSKKLSDLGIDPKLLRINETQNESRPTWLVQGFLGLIYGDRDSRREYQRLKEYVRNRQDLEGQLDRVLLLARKLCRERQWLVRYRELRKFIGAWRFAHRWMAIVMFAAVAYHVLVSVRFGSLWILGGGH